MADESTDWREHRLFILSELRSLRAELQTVNINITALREKDLSQVRVDIAMLQVKSGMWGAVAGGLVMLIPLLVKIAT